MSLVSIIIPTYKRTDTLGRAISSVLDQSYKDLEILVVDDNEKGSKYSYQVLEIVNNFSDKRLRLVTQANHINGAEARNEGIRASKGEYIAFLDDDDEWLPSKIEKQLEFIEKSKDCDGVSCLYNEYRNNILVHSCRPYTSNNLHKKIFKREVAVFTSTLLLKKEALLESSLFDNTLSRHQDLQLLLDFTKKHKLNVLNEYLVRLNLDSNINKPSYEKLVEIKKSFFDAVSPHLKLYSQQEQQEIYAAHRFELAFAALKEHRWRSGVRQIAKVGLNFAAYKDLWQRYKNRKFVAES